MTMIRAAAGQEHFTSPRLVKVQAAAAAAAAAATAAAFQKAANNEQREGVHAPSGMSAVRSSDGVSAPVPCRPTSAGTSGTPATGMPQIRGNFSTVNVSYATVTSTYTLRG